VIFDESSGRDEHAARHSSKTGSHVRNRI